MLNTFISSCFSVSLLHFYNVHNFRLESLKDDQPSLTNPSPAELVVEVEQSSLTPPEHMRCESALLSSAGCIFSWRWHKRSNLLTWMFSLIQVSAATGGDFKTRQLKQVLPTLLQVKVSCGRHTRISTYFILIELYLGCFFGCQS